MPVGQHDADAARVTHRLHVLREEYERAPKVSWALHQDVMNTTGPILLANFEDQIPGESLLGHELGRSEAMIRMTDVTPSERLLTHVTQDHVPLGELLPERVERLINVIDELEHLFTGYGSRPPWSRRQAAMLAKCHFMLMRPRPAAAAPIGEHRWQEHLETTGAWTE